MNQSAADPEEEERVPYQITHGSEPYLAIRPLPVIALLEDVRSLHNVGSFFRTADATAIDSLILCGITGVPPRKEITKTALGAEDKVPWAHELDATAAARKLRERGYELAVAETDVHAIDLFDWVPRFPVCMIFGNELSGVRPELSAMCDTRIRIPMLGLKHSLNVGTAGGVVLYELLRKYRRMLESVPHHLRGGREALASG